MPLNYEKYTAAEVMAAIGGTDDSPCARAFAAVIEQYGKMIDEQVRKQARKKKKTVTLPQPTCPLEEIALKVLRQELVGAGFTWDG